MKRNLKWLGLGGVLATVLLFAMDLPAKDSGFNRTDELGLADDLFKSCMATVKKDCACIANAGGGGEAPRGLKGDTKVELALGETYALTGTISIQGNDPYLKVDFNKAPWLASRTRTKNPYYRINDSAANWTKYRGKSVTVIGTAKYSVFVDQGRTVLEIYLQPGAEPIVGALRDRYSR